MRRKVGRSSGPGAFTASFRRRRRLTRTVAASILLAPGVLGAAPAARAAATTGRAPETSGSNQVVVTGRVVVAQRETSGTVVIFDGPAVIAGTVRGDVVVFNGTTDISGIVTRNVVVFNGAVHLGPAAQVGGDLVTRQRPAIDSGATVRGDLRRVSSVDVGTSVSFLGRFLFWLAMTVSSLVLGVLLLLFAPRAAEVAARTARERTGGAIGWGIGLFLLLPLAAVGFLVTLVAIPLGIGLLFALGLIYSIGYLASAFALGRRIIGSPSSRFGAFLVGWLILRVVALVPVLGGLAWLGASVFGLGVLAVASRRANHAPEPAIAVPPPPPPAGITA
jgi:hypothetical protein